MFTKFVNTLCQQQPQTVKKSQRSLAHQLGISPTYLSLIRRGLRSPSTDVLEKINEFSRQLSPSKTGVTVFRPFFAEVVRGEKMDENNIGNLVKEFLTANEAAGKSDDTISFYRENLARIQWWLATTGGPSKILNLTPQVIRSLLVYVRTATNRWGTGTTSSLKQASLSTVDAYWRTLQAFFSWLVSEGILKADANPMNKIPRPELPHIVKQDIPLPLIKQAIEHCGRTRFTAARNRAIIMVFLDTGIRLGACASLLLTRINLDTGVLMVWEKGRRQVLVHLSTTALNALKDYLAVRKAFTNDRLWLQENGEPLSKTGIQIMIRRLKTAGSNVHFTPHRFRNSFAMTLLRGGADTFSLQILGGWKDLEMPRHYTEALKVEDAMRVHSKASPADIMAAGKNF